MDDTTPTRLPIYLGGFGIISRAVPPGNRVNARETKILVDQSEAHRRALNAADKAGRPIYRDKMTLRNPDFVTIGDICITAIGQITGRDYQHLRFSGDGSDSVIVMDYDAITPATLQAIWSDCGTPDTASRQLLDSLLLDYRSRAGKARRPAEWMDLPSATTGRSPQPSGSLLTDLLIDLRNFGGERARPLFRAFQEKARGIDDCDSLIRALMMSDGKWDREFLAPYLADRRVTTWRQPTTPQRTMSEKPMQLCDLAANVICWHRGQSVFPPPGAENDLDTFELRLLATWAEERS